MLDFVHLHVFRLQIGLRLLRGLREESNSSGMVPAILDQLAIEPAALFAKVTGGGEH
jgi:hypothetical protein